MMIEHTRDEQENPYYCQQQPKKDMYDDPSSLSLLLGDV